MLFAQRRQKLADLLDDGRLDALGGLVENEQPRQRHERARERQYLLLAARQCAPAPIQKPVQARENPDHALDRTLFGLP